MKKIVIIAVIVGVALGLILKGKVLKPKMSANEGIHEQTKSSQHTGEAKILYYTCGMHPSVRVSPAEYEAGNKNCPICNMFLTPVYEKTDDAASMKNVVSIDVNQAALAGIETEEIKILPLIREIETVGIVAYDPELRTAQEEYLQALKTYKKISKSGFDDAKIRAKDILEAAEIKLKVLGLNEDSIKDLEQKGKADKSLILPEDNMWVYAHIYEHELNWPAVGGKVYMVSEADPSIAIEGEIKSIEPIVQEATRTLRLKILADNKQDILKPNMYVDVSLKIDLGVALALPKEALLDTGKRKLIYVDLGKGNFQMREAVVGPLVQADIKGKRRDFYPLIEGASVGDMVVSKGNFLIDSQSQLGAAASVYGGSLGAEEGEMPPAAMGHQH